MRNTRFSVRAPRAQALRRLGFGLALAAAPVLLSVPAQAQNPILNPNLRLQAVPKLQLQLNPALVQQLRTTKPRVSAAVLDQKFVLRNNLPFIRLENGEEKQLLPLSFMEGAPVGSDEVAPEVADALPYIKGVKIAEVARLTPIKLGKITLYTGVDRRSSMTPVKDQGGRGTCVAFAANAALEVFASIPDDLSEQYSNDLFMRKEGRQACDAGIRTIDAAGYLADGTVVESIWPYTMSAPACNAVPPAGAAAATKYKVKEAQLIGDSGPLGAASIKNPRYLETLIQAGHNIVLGTHVAWGSPNAKGIHDVVIDPATNQPAASRGGHAMLICGFNSVDQYFIVKNSWGASWSNAGYAYLSYDYMRTYAKYGYFIRKVEPALAILNPGVILRNPPVLRLPR